MLGLFALTVLLEVPSEYRVARCTSENGSGFGDRWLWVVLKRLFNKAFRDVLQLLALGFQNLFGTNDVVGPGYLVHLSDMISARISPCS